MRIGELARRLGVPYRDIRYVLEQGLIPPGAEESPGRGEHRDLTWAQTYWLAIVLVLKRSGVRTPLAAKVADFAREAVRAVIQSMGYDHGFDPFRGVFRPSNHWFLEVGDLEVIRLRMEPGPGEREMDIQLPWWRLGTRKAVENPQPIVVMQLDMNRLADLIKVDPA